MNFKNAYVFAKHILEHGGIPLLPNPALTKTSPGWMEVTLYREGCYQIVLVVLLPNAVVPGHRHDHVDSAELWLGGDGFAVVDRIGTLPLTVCEHMSKNLIWVRAGAHHEGRAGASGAVFLSFQKWSIAPGFISDDWQC